ncbi:MAG: hypothetical protein C0399_05720 [Syntrophus sp. (in: bacteria)]|nr:hypothetical protein [Syntrophus sp. (in: bacteria)]
MSDSLRSRIEQLEKIYFTKEINHGLFYDLISEMERSMSCFDEQGHRLTDEEWTDYFNNQFMTREAFIAQKEEFHNSH